MSGRSFILALCLLLLAAVGGCKPRPEATPTSSQRVLQLTLSRVKTLDPALASDVASGLAVGHLYDRLIQYDYQARPYALAPAMADLPDLSADGRTISFRLKPGLVFAADACFTSPTARRVTARDVVVSLLRLADARLHSPGYWILRDHVVGAADFQKQTAGLAPDDFTPYETGIAGLQAPDESTIVIRLERPYPQLLNALAMPFASVVPACAVRQYGAAFAEHPVGSGPFQLKEWRRNYVLSLIRNPDFRSEVNPTAPARHLPGVDEIHLYVVPEQLTAWLLFLQGNLDMTTLGQENLDVVLFKDGALLPDLQERGVRLERVPEFQINYIGFNFRDPVLGSNRKLRQAISLAFDAGKRLEIAKNQILPAHGPIPPGVSGYDPDYRNPFNTHDLARATALLAEAGYAGGIEAKTGRPLRLRFDLGGTDLLRRQQAELFALDMKKLGIEIEPGLNNWPRFQSKLRQGDVQIFRIAWVGDYPDGENFLQLFYGPNTGICNYAYYRNPDYDRLYEQAVGMVDSPARTRLYQRLQAILVEDCPWIFESYPVTFRLVQPWVTGYIPHHFSVDPWKYVNLDPADRDIRRELFKPLRLSVR